MEEDHRDIEAGDVGEKVGDVGEEVGEKVGDVVEEVGGSRDSSLSPDESMVEPISESCDCEDRSEYEKSATLQMKAPEKDSVQVKDKSINKYKKKFK